MQHLSSTLQDADLRHIDESKRRLRAMTQTMSTSEGR